MKRKIKKFQGGGLTGMQSNIAGLQQNMMDVGFGTNQIEDGVRTIRSGQGGNTAGATPPTELSSSIFDRNLQPGISSGSTPRTGLGDLLRRRQTQIANEVGAPNGMSGTENMFNNFSGVFRGPQMKKGGLVKSKSKPAKSTKSASKPAKSASKRGDGIATKGKTRGRII